MIDTRTAPSAAFVLRLSLGVLFPAFWAAALVVQALLGDGADAPSGRGPRAAIA